MCTKRQREESEVEWILSSLPLEQQIRRPPTKTKCTQNRQRMSEGEQKRAANIRRVSLLRVLTAGRVLSPANHVCYRGPPGGFGLVREGRAVREQNPPHNPTQERAKNVFFSPSVRVSGRVVM